jgi:hypothetical protein
MRMIYSRRTALSASLVVLTIALSSPAQSIDALQQAMINPKVLDLLDAFPAGGPPLQEAIARTVENDSSLVNDVALAASSANSFQWQAIRSGLVEAANFFATMNSVTSQSAARQIELALGTELSSSPSTTSVAQGVSPLPNVAGIGSGQSGPCVSPSRPGC